ncbi:MAG: hypothetical protein M3014_09580 [Chloroflexota bacterium]|nr:hypothetical protein [Chloroflexota bacterium]
MDQNSGIARKLQDTLPPAIPELLRAATDLAEKHGWDIYLVGGFVRDLLLGIASLDVDLSVVGDAATLAEEVAQQSGATVRKHSRFGTATLTPQGGGAHLDVVTARRETYASPGALPSVEEGTITDDLARRDFTVNALAVALRSNSPHQLLDPHSGMADLEAKVIRVLHSRSFIDDATRIFRAVKLATRLGFKMEQATVQLILEAVRDGVLATISTQRAIREVEFILQEPKASEMLATLERFGVLRAVHPELGWPYESGRMSFEDLNIDPLLREESLLAVMAAEYADEPPEAERIARELLLTAPQVRLMRDAATLMGRWQSLSEEEQRPSRTYALLNDLGVRALEAVERIPTLQSSGLAHLRLQSYLTELRHTKPQLKGEDLQRLGVEPGPDFKLIQDRLRASRLDGEAPRREDEEALVRRWLRERIGHE